MWLVGKVCDFPLLITAVYVHYMRVRAHCTYKRVNSFQSTVHDHTPYTYIRDLQIIFEPKNSSLLVLIVLSLVITSDDKLSFNSQKVLSAHNTDSHKIIRKMKSNQTLHKKMMIVLLQ